MSPRDQYRYQPPSTMMLLASPLASTLASVVGHPKALLEAGIMY